MHDHSHMINGLDAILCTRPSPYGNPHVITPGDTAENAVAAFRSYCERMKKVSPVHYKAWLFSLRGHNLACYCHIWQCPKCKKYCDQYADSTGPHCMCDGYTTMQRVPCHVDVLLELLAKEQAS